MQAGKGIQTCYQKFVATLKEKPTSSERLTKKDFGDFIKFITKEIKLEADIQDLYLFFGKKLSSL